MEPILIIGAGLAGSEAAWQILKRGGQVVLCEMKPDVYSPAHRVPSFAELVCSNSFKAESLDHPSGVLKEEMRRLDSLILQTAAETKVPAGGSLAVDRVAFSKLVTNRLESMKNLKVIHKEVTSIPRNQITIVASGPLTSEGLSQEIEIRTGLRHLFFYDAISPIVVADSIDFGKTFEASRYGKGGGDFVNCPMDRDRYDRFVRALGEAERVPMRDFEKKYLFEGCLPVEELAERGRDTLAYGPLKPVGLIDPKNQRQPFAVVQLRREDRCTTGFNLVGFQTRLKQREQQRVFRMIPGLGQAEFIRWGSMHRNTFIDSPQLLRESLQFQRDPLLFFAGQITGVEGYMESTAMGLLAGLNAQRAATGMSSVVPPPTTAMGSLVRYVCRSKADPFQPMNMNVGLFPPIDGKGRWKRQLLSRRALEDIMRWKEEIEKLPIRQ